MTTPLNTDGILYFGSLTGSGLCLHSQGRVADRDGWNVVEGWLDTFTREEGRDQTQGRARYYQRDGYSVINWWDRSGPDKRGGIHSAFVFRGDMTAVALLDFGAKVWPEVMARQPVPITVIGWGTP